MAECRDIYKILPAVAAVVIVYFFILRLKFGVNSPNGVIYNDFMNVKVFDFPMLGEPCCSWWPISHFVLFFILGYLYPSCGIVLMVLGAAWEGIEVIVNYLEGSPRGNTRTSSKLEYSENWWAGSFKDIIFNVAGFFAGKLLADATVQN